jgi:plasmid stabilization system protein ParE
MALCVFTEKAERDLEKIIDYTVARWGDIQATQYIESLQETAQLLASNPGIGVKRDTAICGIT